MGIVGRTRESVQQAAGALAAVTTDASKALIAAIVLAAMGVLLSVVALMIAVRRPRAA